MEGILGVHGVIDGAVRSASRVEPGEKPDSVLAPDAIAQTSLSILRRPRSAWSLEVELRPWIETFQRAAEAPRSVPCRGAPPGA